MAVEQNLDPTSIDAAIVRYAEGPVLLEAAVAGFTQAELDTRLDETSWSIRQIVHHVADGDDLWKVFIKQAIGSPGGRFLLNWYWDMTQDEWVHGWKYAALPVEPSLALLRANRALTAQLLRLVPEAWGNTLHIIWPSGKDQWVSVGEVVEMQTRHVLGHVDDICEIREARLVQRSLFHPKAANHLP